MASTVYDQLVANNAQYVPNYVGSNVNEINNAAQVIEERYRRNRELSDKVAMVMANEQYLETDKSIKEGLTESIYGSINKIAESEENFENSTAAVSKLARDFYTNKERIAALDNFKRVEQAKTLRSQLGAEALNFGDDPDNFSTIDPNTGQPRRFNAAIEKRADYSRKMQELLGRVATDGYTTDPTGQKVNFNDYERMLIKTGQVHFLNRDKLNKLVEGLLPSYKNSAEGQQDVRRLTNLEGYTNSPRTISNGKFTRQTTDVDEDIRERFRAIAAPQAFAQSNLRWDDFGVPVAKTGIPGNVPNFSPTQPGSVTDNTSINPIRTTEDEFTNKVGDRYYQYIHRGTGQPLAKESNPDLPEGPSSVDAELIEDFNNNYERIEVDPRVAEQAIVSSYEKARSYLPPGIVGYKDLNAYKDAYKQAVKNHAKITPSGNRIEPEQAQQYDDLINRSVVSSPLYFATSGKPVQGLAQLAEDIGTSPSNIQLKAVNVFYDSPRADLPGGYIEAKIEVKGDSDVEKHPTSVFIPLNDQFAALASPIDHLYKNSFYAGQDTYTPERPYVPTLEGQPMRNNKGELLAFYTVTFPLPKDQQEEGKPGFRSMVYRGKVSPNASGGQDVIWEDNPMSIGAWKQSMIQALTPSFKNALNSGQTFNAQDYKKQGLEY